MKDRAFRRRKQGGATSSDKPNVLAGGQWLTPGASLTSANGAYTLTLQHDGNLVLAARGNSLWSTGTSGKRVAVAQVRPSGALVLYTPHRRLTWRTPSTRRHHRGKEVKLILQDDGNLVLFLGRDPIWSTGTGTDTTKAVPPTLQSKEDKEETERLKERLKGLTDEA